MQETGKYTDSVRQQAISLYQQGKGYKAVARELGLTRDTVRNWVATFRLTGRTVPAHSAKPKAAERKPSRNTIQQREERYGPARLAFEQTSASLREIAKRYGVDYSCLWRFLQKHHPESIVKHKYVQHMEVLRKNLLRMEEEMHQALLALTQPPDSE